MVPCFDWRHVTLSLQPSCRYEKKFKRNLATFADTERGQEQAPFGDIFRDDGLADPGVLFESSDGDSRTLQRRGSRPPGVLDSSDGPNRNFQRRDGKPEFRRPRTLQ